MQRQFALGIDAGGSKTEALLAELSHGQPTIIGTGITGPANLRSVGREKAREALTEAFDQATAIAGLERVRLSSICVAAAGAGREAERKILQDWAADKAATVLVTHDAHAVLVAGCDSGSGIALIAGTGSLAFGRDPFGNEARAGGWGHLFGDEGSGYALGVACLRAVARACDGRGPETSLMNALFERLRIQTSDELVAAVYDHPLNKHELARLAVDVVCQAELGDAVACQLVEQSARDLAEMVRAVLQKLRLPNPVEVAGAGGLFCHCSLLRESLSQHLLHLGIPLGNLCTVNQPAQGALRLAIQACGDSTDLAGGI